MVRTRHRQTAGAAVLGGFALHRIGSWFLSLWWFVLLSVCRGFKDSEIEHVEGSVDPVRDLEIITNELVMKDLEKVTARLEVVTKLLAKGQDKSKKQDVATLTQVKELLDAKKDVRFGAWKNDDIDILNEQQFLTAKPVVYLVNIGNDEYALQKNKYLAKINEWVKNRDPYGKIIPFSASFESAVCAFGDDEVARKAFLDEKKVKSMIPKIITTGYTSLDLIQYFTTGEVEVRAWTVKKGTLAPAAAGVIHSDFMKHFSQFWAHTHATRAVQASERASQRHVK